MRILKRLSFSLLSFSLYAFGLSSEVWPAPIDFEEGRIIRELQSGVRTAKLSNGIRVLMYRRGIAPVFAGAVVVRVGTTDELPHQSGAAHMLEHMAFKGTTTVGTKNYYRESMLLAEQERLTATGNISSFGKAQRTRWQEINEELETIWDDEALSRLFEARGAVDFNATVDTELTRFFVSLPRDAFEFWCFIESERLIHPVMRQFYKERDVVLEERRLRDQDDPEGKLWELMLNQAFRIHPYRKPIIGYDIETLTATHIADFQKRFYVPDKIVLSLVGDITPEKDLKTLEEYFGRLPVQAAPARTRFKEPEQKTERRVSLAYPASPEVLIAYKKTPYPHPDDPALTIMHGVLTRHSTSPLYKVLVKEKRLAVQVTSSDGPGDVDPNLLIFKILPQASHSNAEVIRAFDKVVAAFKETGISDEQLQFEKKAISMGYLSQFGSNLSLALIFGDSEALFGNWKAAIDWYTDAMTVTRADVRRVARTYLVSKSRTIATLSTK
jgi:predicted Zn-dependent peptidase